MSTTLENTPSNVEVPAEPAASLLFSDLGLSSQIELAVQMTGYLHPTAVQAEIIPEILRGRDVLAQSQTGTGKTAAFALPILSRLEPGKRLPQVLVLTPTRELALQVSQAFETYGACIPKLRILAIYGGADYQPQLRSLRQGVDIVVGTPGRVIDHLTRGTLVLDELTCLVLDEADEMLNMGFQEDVEQILSKTPEKKQVALFSATMPDPIRRIADQHLVDPVTVTIRKKSLTNDSIVQRCVFVPERDKMELLTRLLELEETDGVIVFTKTKESTIRVADLLIKNGISAAALNGDLPQLRRQQTVDRLKSGQLDVLVATDVAARGLDVQRISHVFNYDLPHDGEAYVHRIGRTGRAGRTGVAYIFLTPIQRGKLRLIEKVTKQAIEVVDLPASKQINLKRIERFKSELTQTIASDDISAYHKLITEYAFETDTDLITIAAALAHLARRGQPLFVRDMKADSMPSRGDKPGRGRDFDSRDDRGGRPRREHSEGKFSRGDRRSSDDRGDRSEGKRPRKVGGKPGAGMQRFQLAVGSQDGVRPGNIVGAIANESGISGGDIGPIEIRGNFTLIDLPADLPQSVIQILRRTWVAGKQLKIRPFDPR